MLEEGVPSQKDEEVSSGSSYLAPTETRTATAPSVARTGGRERALCSGCGVPLSEIDSILI